jgi:single-strand DNA-binding protein
MADLNRVFLMGRLTQDPELRYTGTQIAVTELRLATSRSWTGKDGERREDTLYIDVTVWNRQAENCCQYLRKGSPVHIEGYLKLDTWDDKTTGKKQSKVRVEADRVQFLGSRREDGGNGSSGGDDYGAPAREPRRAPSDSRADNGSGGRSYPASGGSGASRRPAAAAPPDDAPADDDIPF